ncbi:transmembrane protein, putative [Rhizoctonia solani AG-3 Rhs1AP]|uniref:Transmembrane protein, putative n=2 Tax=Rhizoctonia solani AG-3 TaxID=1086053 RepID=A0A0A1UKS0_9AGAM|nr:transmembrane protein, putative [Rhizoctonia solani AG-3 Rhs1AP]KEP46933.1 putative transmembrane protein [Rhizoctonia solani 123E]
MPLTRQWTTSKTAFRKSNLRNGAVLALSQVAKVVNLPIAHDVARHIRQVTVALKPSVLQAPKNNDSSAKELANHVAGLLDVLDTALPYLDNTEELEQLYNQLRDAHAELEDMQTSDYATKFASQTEIRERIMHMKEGMSRTVVDLTLRLLAVMLVSRTRDHQHTRKAPARVEQRLALSNQRIGELERICKGLQRQGGVHEVILIRYTDERRIPHLVWALNGFLFFFLHVNIDDKFPLKVRM